MTGRKLTLNHSLTVKFFYLLVTYILLALMLVFISFNARFGIGWDALIKSPAGNRIEVVADAMAQRFSQTARSTWNETLRKFGETYQVEFYLFSPDGTQIAGEPVVLPAPLKQRLLPPGPRFFGPPPPPPPAEFEGARTVHARLPPHFGAGRPANHMISLHEGPYPPHEGAPGPPLANMPDELRHAHGRFLFHTDDPDMFWLGCRLMFEPPAQNGEQRRPMPCTLLAKAGNMWQSGLLIDLKFILLILTSVLLLSLCFWLPFIISITRKLSELTRATEKIAEGQFETRLEHKGSDEIGRLAEAINSMSERISIFVTWQKRLMGDISHELCSPIARLQMALELLEETSQADTKPLIDDIREEVIEMNNLVNELLAFSKAEMKGAVKNLVEVPLKPLFSKLSEKLIPEGRASLMVADDLAVIADPMLLERGVANVIRNSARYGGDGTISITAERDSEDRSQVIIVIADEGPGVPEEALKHLGEPFFRPDAARSRSQGGAGLGLAIVKSCVAACEGDIEITNRTPRGLQIRIVLRSA